LPRGLTSPLAMAADEPKLPRQQHFRLSSRRLTLTPPSTTTIKIGLTDSRTP
jgi:hypothetical protein